MAVESVPLSEILIPSGTEPDLDHIRARNARSVWHPMAHPGVHQANPPRIITGAEGVYIEDDEGHRVIDAVGGRHAHASAVPLHDQTGHCPATGRVAFLFGV